MEKLGASIIAIPAIAIFANCDMLILEDEKVSINGKWIMIEMTEDICFCAGQPNCCGTIIAPGEFEGCKLDLEGYFLFTTEQDSSNNGRLTGEQTLTNSCETEPDRGEIDVDYLYDPIKGTLTLVDGDDQQTFDVVLDKNTLLLSYEDRDGDAYIKIEFKFRR